MRAIAAESEEAGGVETGGTMRIYGNSKSILSFQGQAGILPARLLPCENADLRCPDARADQQLQSRDLRAACEQGSGGGEGAPRQLAAVRRRPDPCRTAGRTTSSAVSRVLERPFRRRVRVPGAPGETEAAQDAHAAPSRGAARRAAARRSHGLSQRAAARPGHAAH